MRVCYFGQYDPDYARNQIIRHGLTLAGVEVVPCLVKMELGFPHRYLALSRKFSKIPKPFDAVIVAEVNQPIVFLAKMLTQLYRLPLIFDPFISRYDTLVIDRGIVPQNSTEARYLYWTDRLSMNLADHVFADTYQHRLYYQEKFKVHRPIGVVPIGANTRIFYPQPAESKKNCADSFEILFWGTFIPLQGIQFILKAAYILQQHRQRVCFKLVGNGQTFTEMQRIASEMNLTNVTFLNYIATKQLPAFIQTADVVLGVFGNTQKTLRVVPNKLYEGLAMGKPVITGDTPALREFFTPGQHLHAVPVANPESLAEAIIQLIENKEYRYHLAQQGYEHFSEHFTPRIIGQSVREIIENLASKPVICCRLSEPK
jgi:glycosyltransferase involved in cell wall biosynthesis